MPAHVLYLICAIVRFIDASSSSLPPPSRHCLRMLRTTRARHTPPESLLKLPICIKGASLARGRGHWSRNCPRRLRKYPLRRRRLIPCCHLRERPCFVLISCGVSTFNCDRGQPPSHSSQLATISVFVPCSEYLTRKAPPPPSEFSTEASESFVHHGADLYSTKELGYRITKVCVSTFIASSPLPPHDTVLLIQ